MSVTISAPFPCDHCHLTIHPHPLQHRRRPRVAARPVDRDLVHARRLAEAESQRQLALAEVAAPPADFAALLAAVGQQDDPLADGQRCCCSACRRPPDAGAQCQWLPVRFSHRSRRGAAVGREDDVERAVAVEVQVGAAASDQRVEEVRPRRLRRDEAEARRLLRLPVSRIVGPIARKTASDRPYGCPARGGRCR